MHDRVEGMLTMSSGYQLHWELEKLRQIKAEMESLSQEFQGRRDTMVNSEPTPELIVDQLVLEVKNLSELKDLFGDPHPEMWRLEVRGGHAGEALTICVVREFHRMETEEEFTARKHKFLGKPPQPV